MVNKGRSGVGKTELDFLDWIRPQLSQVEEFIRQSLQDDHPLTTEIAQHLQDGGGKRLRPALVLLGGAVVDESFPSDLIPVSAAVEIIHMATLVHDDTIDKASLRRGVPTVNHKWNSEIAILIGDFLFARGFSLLAEYGGNAVVRIMADVVFRMSSGEIEQLSQAYDLNQNEESYLTRIDKKTAYFIGESCRLGAVVSGSSAEIEHALRRFGFNIGMSYQIIDDLLDFGHDPQEIGKPIGNDLRSGVLTLPVLYALEHAEERERAAALIRSQPQSDEEIEEIRQIVRNSGGLEYAEQVAQKYTDEAMKCLAMLPPGKAHDTLMAMANFLLERTY